MNEYQRIRLESIIDSLISWPICAPFVNCGASSNQGLISLIAHTTNKVDLKTIKQRLLSKEYKSVSEFESDVNLVWNYGKKINPKNNLVAIMAEEAEFWFNKKMKAFPCNPVEEWIFKSRKAVQQFSELFEHTPLESNSGRTVSNTDDDTTI